jgi:hypothetical protein
MLMRSVGAPNDQTLLDGKWESLALAPAGDPKFPDDYFLFTVVSPIAKLLVKYMFKG